MRFTKFFCISLLLVSQVCFANTSLIKLRNLEVEAGQANHASAFELEKLNKSCFENLLKVFKTHQNIRATLTHLYEYELFFPEASRGIYPFRSTIAQLSCLVAEQAPENVIEEKIQEFLSVHLALKTAFEQAGDRFDLVLDDSFIKVLTGLLTNRAMVKHDCVVPQVPQASEGEGGRRSIVGTGARVIAGMLGAIVIGYGAKRFIVDPVRRYKNIVDMAEEFLKKVKDLPADQMVKEAIKAMAELPEDQQKQFMSLVFKAVEHKQGDIDKKELIKNVVAELPEEQQRNLIKMGLEVAGEKMMEVAKENTLGAAVAVRDGVAGACNRARACVTNLYRRVVPEPVTIATIVKEINDEIDESEDSDDEDEEEDDDDDEEFHDPLDDSEEPEEATEADPWYKRWWNKIWG